MIFRYSRATWLFSSENYTKWDYALFFPDNDERLDYSSWTSPFYMATFVIYNCLWNSVCINRRPTTCLHTKIPASPFSFTQFSLWQTCLCVLFNTLATAEEPPLWRYSLHFLHLPYFEISINPIFFCSISACWSSGSHSEERWDFAEIRGGCFESFWLENSEWHQAVLPSQVPSHSW